MACLEAQQTAMDRLNLAGFVEAFGKKTHQALVSDAHGLVAGLKPSHRVSTTPHKS